MGAQMEVGIDIEEIKRFQKSIKDKKFIERVFSKDEIKYCSSKKNSIQHYAARFAGKEAVWKAINKYKKISIPDISFKNSILGKPEVYIKGKKQKNIEVSFSHNRNTVVAVAVFSR